MAVGYQAIGAVNFLAGRSEDLIQQFTLFVAEEILEGILSLPEVLVHQPDDLGKVSPIEGFMRGLGQLFVRLGLAIEMNPTVQMMAAHVENSVG